ncbi:MAG: radical SAM protein [Candidatus Omnitrophica bacterium]|nr:radical SAM protein [Candidatus Omnitrophota bacterium]
MIVILCVTNKCNLKCWYCYGQHGKRIDWKEFSKNEILKMIGTLREMGTQILQLQGGEPLLRDDLKIIIEEAKKSGMICDMVTNGTLISQNVETIKLLDKICISLDGPKETHEKNCGEGTFNKSLEGIKRARSLGLPVRLSTVLTQNTTVNDIDWLSNFAKDNCISVNFSPSFAFVSSVKSTEDKPHDISDDQMRTLLKHIIICKKMGYPIQFTEKSYEIAASWPFSYKKRTVLSNDNLQIFKKTRCLHGDFVIFIDSDGSVYPCCNFWGRPELNVRKDGLRNSILKLSKKDCMGCYIPAYIDRNLFFNLDPKAWLHYIKKAIKGDV